MDRLTTALGWLVLLAGVVIATWPMAAAPATRLLGTPGLEATDHLWTLWAALHDGPLVIDTELIRYPEGYSWVLADPLNLLWFALPTWIGGAPLGFNAVHLGNLAVAGLGAWALGREILPDRPQAAWLTALVAVSSSTLAGGFFTGMSEAQTWGWIGLALAAVHRAARTTALKDLVLAGVLSGLCAWCGVYTALYAGMAALPVVLSGLLRSEAPWPRRLGALGGSAAIAGALAAPIAWAVSTSRDESLPGATSLTDAVLQDPTLPQNRMLGADLVGIFWPQPSAVGADLHAVYLGVVAVLLALLGLVLARRQAWSLLLAAAWMILLGLGLYLQVGGEIITTGDGRVLFTPAGWLSFAFEDLGRAPRWYRAVSVASILLAPLAGIAGAWLLGRLPVSLRPVGVLLLGGLVLADAVGASPLPWPRDTYDALPPEGYAQLVKPGPIIEVPSVRFSTVVPGRPATASGGGTRMEDAPIRHPSLLWQTKHLHPLGGSPHQAERRRTDRESSKAVDKLLDAAVHGKDSGVSTARHTLQELGFVYLIHHPAGHPPEVQEGLRSALGPPQVDTDRLVAWELPPLEE